MRLPARQAFGLKEADLLTKGAREEPRFVLRVTRDPSLAWKMRDGSYEEGPGSSATTF